LKRPIAFTNVSFRLHRSIALPYEELGGHCRQVPPGNEAFSAREPGLFPGGTWEKERV
jgi:hypothetical protein